MAGIPFLYPIDLNLLELLNARFQQLASDPGSPVEGQFWYNTTSHQLKYYDGTTTHIISMTYLLARANHTGTQAASTISDLATVVKAYRLDEFAAPTADVSLNSHKLTNVTDPTSAQDAATKAYADALKAGLFFKDPVRVATTANITLSGAQTIDGVSVIAGDRVLVKAQTTGANNGIYVCASGAWSRATDADSSAEMKSGTACFVDEGTANADTQWLLTTNDPITLGTTALVFTQFGGGATYTADESTLHLAGTQFSIKSTDVRPVANGGTGAVDAAGAKTNLGFMSRYATDVGDGSATSYTVTHNLGTRDVIVLVRDNSSPYAQVLPDVEMTTTNTVTVKFAVAPSSNKYRVIVQG